MGIFFRKGLNFDLFKINLSKSGIGISTGIKGLRFGFGQKGAYVNAGRGGLYFRKSLNNRFFNNNAELVEDLEEREEIQPTETEINTATLAKIEITGEKISPSDLCKFLNKRNMIIKSLFAAWFGLGILFAFTTETHTLLSGFSFLLSLFCFLAGCIALIIFLIKRMDITATCFEVEDISKFNDFLLAFSEYSTSLHMNLDSKVKTETKGAIPRFTRTSNKELKLPCIVINCVAYFFTPEFVLVKNEFGNYYAGSYNDFSLTIKLSYTNIKSHQVFLDEKILEQTWEHVNKDGSPSLRYKDNRPIYLSRFISFTFMGNTWICSNKEIVENLVNTIKCLKENINIKYSYDKEPNLINII